MVRPRARPKTALVKPSEAPMPTVRAEAKAVWELGMPPVPKKRPHCQEPVRNLRMPTLSRQAVSQAVPVTQKVGWTKSCKKSLKSPILKAGSAVVVDVDAGAALGRLDLGQVALPALL